MLLSFIESKIKAFEGILAQGKNDESKVMNIFKFPNLTLLTSIVFDNIQAQLNRSIGVIGA